MNKKSVHIILGCSLLGFSIGFFITESFVVKPHVSSASTLALANQGEQVAPLQEVKSEDVSNTPKVEQAPELPTVTSADSNPEAAEQDILKQENNKTPTPKNNNCPVPEKKYDDYTYLDVGQVVSIPDMTYTPPDLVELSKDITKYPNTCLRKEAADSLASMIAAAKVDGYGIKVSSAFRSYDTQKFLLQRSIDSGNKNARELIAKPGYSEHQLGLAVDLTSPSINNASSTPKFGNTKESEWLENNAYLYGFVESYPEDKEDITGYMHEAWHYRYVGVENATDIRKNNQTVNQYLKAKKDSEAKKEVPPSQ